MVSKVIYVFFPFLLAIGLLRKFREYQWGYCKSKSSLNGKVFIVTGANSGIGKETVRELARRKARVIMACRDLGSAKNAIEDIRRDVSSGELVSVYFRRLFTLDSVQLIVFVLFFRVLCCFVEMNNEYKSLGRYMCDNGTRKRTAIQNIRAYRNLKNIVEGTVVSDSSPTHGDCNGEGLK